MIIVTDKKTATKKSPLRYLPLAIGLALIVALTFFIYGLIHKFEKPVQGKKQIQQVTMIQPPPPPPPPDQPPPPPEQVEQKVDEPAPAPEPEPEAAPASDLGIDAEGGAGSDNFGLVGRRGGQSLLGGGSGNAIIWYGQKLSAELSDALRENLNEKVRAKKFQVQVNVWVDGDGAVQRAELESGSNDTVIDAELRRVLGNLQLRLAQLPPPNMPQPVKIKVSN